MGGRVVELDGVGKVTVEQSRRARRIRISVKAPETVRVAVPYGVSYEQAKAFAESKKIWIVRELSRLQETRLLDASAIFDKNCARESLLERLETLSRLHRLFYNRAFVRNQKTRWASCSSSNNISLNIRLILLPELLLDYVLLHELVHTRIKDHSTRFWKMLEGFVEDAKTLDRGLRRFRLT